MLFPLRPRTTQRQRGGNIEQISTFERFLLYILPLKPRTWQIVCHIVVQTTMHGLYVTAVAIDVAFWREGPLCTASVICNPLNATAAINASGDTCDKMTSDLKLMFFLYTTAVAAGTLKVLVVIAMMLCSTKSFQSMMAFLPDTQRSETNEWRARYTVCAAWSFAISMDAWLMLVSMWRLVIVNVQTSSYANDLFPQAQRGWSILGLMISAITTIALFDAIMIYKSKKLCNGI
jgi:hypothetical protein